MKNQGGTGEASKFTSGPVCNKDTDNLDNETFLYLEKIMLNA